MSIFKKLNSIVDTLHSKGYNGYLLTSQQSPGKAREIIGEYLQRQQGNNAATTNGLWCSTYIKWDGEDKPRVLCDMWMFIQQDDLVLKKMIIEKKDRYDQLLKSKTLTDLSIQNMPTVMEAIAMVGDTPKINYKTTNSNRFRL